MPAEVGKMVAVLGMGKQMKKSGQPSLTGSEAGAAQMGLNGKKQIFSAVSQMKSSDVKKALIKVKKNLPPAANKQDARTMKKTVNNLDSKKALLKAIVKS